MPLGERLIELGSNVVQQLPALLLRLRSLRERLSLELLLQIFELLIDVTFPQCRFEPAICGHVAYRQDHRRNAVGVIEQRNRLEEDGAATA